jgi:hypothetical protein
VWIRLICGYGGLYSRLAFDQQIDGIRSAVFVFGYYIKDSFAEQDKNSIVYDVVKL